MKLTQFIKTATLVSMMASSLLAGTFNVDKNKDKELLETAKKIMPSTDIKKVMATEVPNMLAVLLANEEVVYIYPPKKLILIGEIYNADGVSISDKHIEKLGAKKIDDGSEGPLDISPLFRVSTRMSEGNHKYGFIVFTDPDCPFCQQLDNFLLSKGVTVDYVYTPIDSLHPQARAKAVKSVMEKNNISEAEATKKISEGEKIATGLGIKGTPQTIVYEIETKKPINGITGADIKAFGEYLQGAK